MEPAEALIALCDDPLAAALEMALLAAGFAPAPLDLDPSAAALPPCAAVLILGPDRSSGAPDGIVGRLRARGWRGRLILIADDRQALRKTLEADAQLTVLEMPFVASELIAALRDPQPPP